MLLVIDSATAACSAALVEDGNVMGERHELVGRGHAERLIPMVEELLGGRRPAELLVDCGPGSFTGVRVGLAAAHGLAIGWRIPLFGYSSLALVAAQAGGAEVAVATHGGHGEFFVQSYGGDPLVARDSLRSLAPDAAAASISSNLVLGSAAESLVSLRGYGAWRDAVPRAADARLLAEPLRRLPPVPIYGRAPDAKPAPC